MGAGGAEAKAASHNHHYFQARFNPHYVLWRRPAGTPASPQSDERRVVKAMKSLVTLPECEATTVLFLLLSVGFMHTKKRQRERDNDKKKIT